MEWSGRAPAPPASYAGKGRQRQGARYVFLGNGRVVDEVQKKHLPGITYIAIDGKGWRVPVEGSLE